MDKEYFLRELSYLLSDIDEEEREAALDYYQEYFAEMSRDEEAEALQRLGSPEKVAAEIRCGLRGDSEDAGEISERGYRDERFAEDNRVPDKYTEIIYDKEGNFEGHREYRSDSSGWRNAGNSSKNMNDAAYVRERRRNGILLLLLFVVFGLPLMSTILGAGFSVIFGIIGALFGVFGGLLGLVIAAIAMVVGFVGGGIGMIIAGVMNLSTPAIGLMGICLGFLSLALGVLSILLVGVGFRVVPEFIRFCVVNIRKLIRWLIQTVRGLIMKLRGGVV